MITLTSTAKWTTTLLVLLALTLTLGCNTQSGGPLSKTFEAHGGLENWRSQQSFVYTLDGFPLSEQVAKPTTSTVDLQQRLHRIEGQNFLAGYDGQDGWALPNDEAAGLPPRFYTLGSFYFIAMPFVFGDPGTFVEEKGIGTFRGKAYNVYQITFAKDVGHSSRDEYVAYVDPQTHRLALIHHTVSEKPGVDRVTWTFDQWQEESGLIIPAKMSFIPGWDPDTTEQGASFTIDNATFSQNRPSPGQFQKPQEYQAKADN